MSIGADSINRLKTSANPEGDRGPPPLKNHKNIGFLSNTGHDPLRTRIPLIVVFGSSIPSSTKKLETRNKKKKKKKKTMLEELENKFDPLTKLSGSVHEDGYALVAYALYHSLKCMHNYPGRI